jgi:CCR4-NOT complex subunit CAF16
MSAAGPVARVPGGTPPAVEVRGLDFRYRPGERLALRNVRLTVPRGSRCLLLGRNGAGKTTLLRVLAGRHLVEPEVVRVLGRPAFHDPSLAGRVAFLGGDFPFNVDVRVGEILARDSAAKSPRRERLIEILGVDRDWHMDRVSAGQRRRVQLLLGLMHPTEVLLLDEATSDLDLLARADLLAFLHAESERGATLLYATHVLDDLEGWATHVVLMEDGAVRREAALADLGELAALRAANVGSPLTRLALGWLRPGAG